MNHRATHPAGGDTVTVNWAVARAVARVATADLPRITRPEAVRLTCDLRMSARRAGGIAADFLGITGNGAERVAVVDWDGWLRVVEDCARRLSIDLGSRRTGALGRVRGLGYGAVTGLILGRMVPRLLGQYDGLVRDTVYLVAPSVLAHERRLGLDASDFRLWVGLHEQAHALQFQQASWLREYLLSQLRIVLADDVSWRDGGRGWRASGDLLSLVVSGGARPALRLLVSAMTFLEGHADHVADTAGRGHIRTLGALRRFFDREARPTALSRLLSGLDKASQYRDGRAFCREVVAAAGSAALGAAFDQPKNLPTAAELAAPRDWVRRVHG